MNMETFELIPIAPESIGEDQLKYLQENMECEGLQRDGNVLAVELPQFVELKIVETDPGLRGDTASGGTKPATLATGAVVQVPLFVEIGETIRVDRTEDKYVTRVS
jgi:elongation factor P